MALFEGIVAALLADEAQFSPYEPSRNLEDLGELPFKSSAKDAKTVKDLDADHHDRGRGGGDADGGLD